MYRIRINILIAFLCLLSPKPLANPIPIQEPASDNRPAQVLILSSYDPTNEWAFLIHRDFSSYIQRAKKTEILTEHLDLSPQTDMDTIRQKASEIKNKYRYKNKIVILLGEDAWIFYRTFLGQSWKDIPAIAVFSGEYTVSLTHYLANKPITEQEKISLDDSRKGMNATVLHDRVHIKETVELMQKLLPKLNSIALITDKRHIGTVIKQQTEHTLQNHFPSLKFINLSMTEYSTEQLKDTIKKMDSETGFIFHSWYTHDSNLISRNFSNNMKLIIGGLTHSPIFTLYDSGVKEGVITGGCYSTIGSIAEELHKLVDKIMEGEKASDLPITVVPQAHCYLNYRNLTYFQIPPKLYPKEAIYYEKPVDYFEKNKTLIIYIVIIALLLASIFFLLVGYKHKKLLDSRRIKEALEKSQELQTAFIANMNHEIRTPLNSIIGFSTLLSEPEQLSEEDRQTSLHLLTENKDLLLELINNIMDLSRLESGTAEVNYETINLKSTINDIVNICKKKSTNPHVRLVADPDVPDCLIQTDWKLLTQVLNNLMSNAMKYTRQGEIRIGYELRKEEIYLYVTDTGCGIPEHIACHIFDKFDKGGSNLQGTGIGLSLCRAIVNELKGKVGLSSKPGEGSTFWFTLPVQHPYKRE